MPTGLKLSLAAALGFACGLLAAAAADCDGPADRPPLVDHPRGHLADRHPPRELRPLTLRVGDELRQLGEARSDRPAVCTVYLDVSGVPVVASFELAPE